MKKPTKGHPNRLANLGVWAHKAGAKAPSPPKAKAGTTARTTKQIVRDIKRSYST